MGGQVRGSGVKEEIRKMVMRGDGQKEVSAVYITVSLGPIARGGGETGRKDNLMPVTLEGGRKSETSEG